MKKILYGSLLLSILQSILFWHKNPGISVILFTIPATLVILYNLKEQKMIKNKKGILWSIPIILLSLTYFIFNNTFFQLLNVPVIFALLILMCISITEEKLSENGFIRNVISKAFKPLAVLFEFISDFEIDEFLGKQKEEQNEKLKTIKTVGKSLLIVIPIILIIILLLSSADSIFGSLFSSISEFISRAFESETISDIIARIIMIIVFFIYIVGFIITFIKKDDTEKQEKETRKINLSILTSNMILISLNIIYLIFSVIQFRYLFMNAGKTPDFDYATYARTGFFQLMFVSFINLALLKITKEAKEKLIQILKILLIIFTMIIVISAMFRMHLYEQEYGYTYLRLFVYFILATEILILIPILMNVCGQKFDTFSISLKIIICMYIILNFINIDYIIARNNIDRYLANPEKNRLDAFYISNCTGTDAINEKIKLLNASSDGLSYERKEYMNNIKQTIKNELSSYMNRYERQDFKWQEWNLSKMKAYNFLKNIDL